MKKFILSVICSLLSLSPVYAESSMADALKEASSGTVSSRFRVGYFGGIGYQARMSGDGDTQIQGLLIEGGVYGLFNPVQNFLDFEVGLSGKYNGGMSTSSNSSSSKKYYAGLKQITIYGGTVFRFGETKKALALGLSKALYISEVQSKELKATGVKKNDLENGMGVYEKQKGVRAKL
jgi:hypothetical protein